MNTILKNTNLRLPDSLGAIGRERPLAALVCTAAVFLVIGGMRVAAPLLTQVLIIAFATITLSPIYDWLVRRRVPPALAVAAVIALMATTCVYIVGFALPRGIWEFSRNIALYHRQLVGLAGTVADWLREQDIDVPKGLLESAVSLDSAQIAGTVRALGGLAGKITMNVLLDVIVIAFLLAELPSLPRKVRRIPFMTEARLAVLTRFSRDVRHYMAIKAAISALTGLSIWLGLKLLGVDSPVLLGFVAFFLNFIPGIGSVMAAVPGLLLALASGVETAAWAGVLYLAANQLLGNVIEPRIMGRGFGVSPALVLLSVLFWGWVLGPVGMLFAIPLTMAVRGTLAEMWR
ncbi:MAG: AI-2E family transporter [Kiritimatiellae bacterium]|nr:AI-2E family transporter [Kiritimatiellia bacterium]